MAADLAAVGAVGRRRTAVASFVSDTLGPLPVLAALCVAGASGRSTVAGLGWGLLAMAFVAVLPYAATWRLRHSADASAPSSRSRATYMCVAAVSAALGLAIVAVAGGPHRLIAAVVAVLATLVVTAVTNAVWHWSNHAAATVAGAAMLTILAGPAGSWAFFALPLVGWARLALRRHTFTQVALGALTGGVISAAVLLVAV